MSHKVCCSEENRENKHRLNPSLFPITYESKRIITNISLPRKYTSTHNDDTREIYLHIGHSYDDRLLSTDEVKNVESQILGKWIKHKGKYQIRLVAYVSTKKNLQAEFRNKVICEEMSPVLEGINLSETCLLTMHPELLKTKIYIHFKSIDKKYDRVEYWGRLEQWG